jgi:type VI protein secretion system component Hcp
MYGESGSERRLGSWEIVLLVAFLLSAWMVIVDRSEAAPAPATLPGESALVASALQGEFDGGGIYAKYEGIDGEAVDEDHHHWIEIGAFEWGAHRELVAPVEPRRVRASVDPEGFTLSFAYEKASPKLEEKAFTGAVIPRLEVEVTAVSNEERVTYLRYEFTNVIVTDFMVDATAGYGRPEVTFTNTFQKAKVTYSEYDPATGQFKGNVEYEFEVE